MKTNHTLRGTRDFGGADQLPTAEVGRGEHGRPSYALEGHEDEVYHELRLPVRGTEPEYCALLDQSWTFNRAMRWTNAANGTLVAHEIPGDLPLTGEHRVSDWFSDPVNRIEHVGTALCFAKTAARQREAVVLPGLQTNLAQHPRLTVEVTEATAAWQVCVLVKGRSGPPLVASAWRDGAGRVELDLISAWHAKGYAIRFAELHIALGLWTATPEAQARLAFTAILPGQAAIVPCLPVIRAAAAATLPVSAVVSGARPARLTATISTRSVELTECGGVWTGTFAGLPPGDYTCEFRAPDNAALRARQSARVTDGNYFSYDAEPRSLVRAGRMLGPLSGSYQGLVYKTGVSTSGERMVNGRAAPSAEPERWHYWEALTEAELEERCAYLETCGWDLLHLCQGWGLWEKLDAGGHLAPHGAEQLALLLRVAGRHGLALLQALSHYPYGSTFTPVLRQYLETGFQDGDWTNPDSAFTSRFHQYLREYTTIFRDETALFALSTSGEGDIAAGPARVNDTYRYVTSLDPNHIFLAEPIHRLHRLPHEHRAQWAVHGGATRFTMGCRTDIAWEPQLAGSRMYWIGEALPPEIDLGVEFKFLAMGDYFMGEGSWPCPQRYARFMGHDDTWAATERYRRRVRDSLYLGLVHRCPILLTWEEQFTENERVVLREVRDLIDWSQSFQEAPVAIRVDSPNVGGGSWGSEGRAVLGQYEDFFSALPLMTRYLTPEQSAPAGLPVLDARQPYSAPALPDELLAASPLRVSPGYRASYLWAADRRTLLAYVCNRTHHECLHKRRDLSGNWHRLPQPAPCDLTLRNLPAGLECRIYSLNDKGCARKLTLNGKTHVRLGVSTDDYLLCATPPGDPK
ncbi:MAG: hypothetical protein K9N49_06450 [Candidatus Marinimicrobia bacterium]|nr:hypothetical protein [Candidatus Neomarinimicrobiota bacterium]